jgi:trimeric autotransporter adhesin
MTKLSPVARRVRRFPSTLAMLAVALLTAAGCESSTSTDNSIAALYVTPPSPIISVGQLQQLVATATNSAGEILDGQSVSWSSSAPGFATVAANGLVTGVGGGTTQITATVGGETATANVTVWFPITAVNLSVAAPATTTIRQEGAVQVDASFTDASGATVTGRQLVWTSSNPAVATVSTSGRVSGLTDGTTEITARTNEGTEGTIVITVSGPPVVATVTIAVTESRFMGIGHTEQMVATARAASGTVLDLVGRTVVWSTSNAGNATVDANGLVTNLVADGTANISVSVDGVAATTPVTIQALPTLANDTPETLDIGAGDFPQFIFVVPAGTDTLRASITGGTGDPDIYVIRPAGTLACAPFAAGSNETCRIAAPVAGRWRIGVEAWAPAGDVAGVELRAVLVNVP